MSHHSPNDDATRALREEMKKVMGEYPKGRLNQDDAGAVAMAIGVESDRVVLRFAKPVAWVGFTGDEAMELAQTLIKHARVAGITAPVIIRVGE